VISNGPYYLDSYSPDARKITIKAFDDVTYPFPTGYWKKFEQISMPKIEGINVPTSVSIGSDLEIPVSVTPNATVYYYFTNPQGKIIDDGKQVSGNGSMTIMLSSQKTATLEPGSHDVQVFVVSDEAYKPDMYHSSFLVTNGKDQFPVLAVTPNSLLLENNYGYIPGIVILGAIIVVIVWYVSKKRNVK